MRIKVDPVPAAASKAEARVNNVLAATAQDIAHYNKRMQAIDIQKGGIPSAEFIEAAAIEGMSVEDFAALVASKPCALMAAENRRRRTVVAVRSAKTVQEIADALAKEGLTPGNSGDALPIV